MLTDKGRNAIQGWLRTHDCEIVCKVLYHAAVSLANHNPIDGCDPEADFIRQMDQAIMDYLGV